VKGSPNPSLPDAVKTHLGIAAFPTNHMPREGGSPGSLSNNQSTIQPKQVYFFYKNDMYPVISEISVESGSTMDVRLAGLIIEKASGIHKNIDT